MNFDIDDINSTDACYYVFIAYKDCDFFGDMVYSKRIEIYSNFLYIAFDFQYHNIHQDLLHMLHL